MKKTVYTLTVMAFALCLCACASNQPAVVDMADNSENSLDWAGTYTGLIPAADAPGINVTITLNPDLTYEMRYEYIDHPDSNFTDTGAFTWDKDGSVIKLDAAIVPPYYKVGENQLTQLDMEGNLITGALADNYLLKKN